MNFRWEEIVSNENLHKIFQQDTWSEEIKRRLGWNGHLLRRLKETPARQVSKEAERKVKSQKEDKNKHG